MAHSAATGQDALSGQRPIAQQSPATAQMRGDGPPPPAEPFSFTRNDPAFDQIVAPDARMIQLAEGFGLSEGGLWIPQGKSGYWIFGGFIDNVLYKVTPEGQLSVFMEKAGYTGDDPEHTGTQTRAGRHHVVIVGPVCTGMDHEGRIIWCAPNDRELMRLEKDGTHTVLSAGMDGQKFSGPNDIAITKDDAIYLTDNDFGLRDAGKNPDKQLQNGIYRIKDGKTTRVLTDTELGGIPNGIALSPDDRWMYLSTKGGMKRYAVNPDGTLGEGSMFFTGPAGDGEKTDKMGNLYSANGGAPGYISVHAPDGRLLGVINVPVYGGEPKRQYCATNEAFGGPDGKTLFIAACDAVFSIRLKVAGPVPAYEVK
jgi:gluconolactonase